METGRGFTLPLRTEHRVTSGHSTTLMKLDKSKKKEKKKIFPHMIHIPDWFTTRLELARGKGQVFTRRATTE